MSAIETVREVLLTQLEPLELEYAAAKERLDTIEQQKIQIEAALKALGTSKKSAARTLRKPGKPFAKKADVMAVCISLVEANQPIAKADLKSLVKHNLAEDQGFSLSGVPLRLKECLESNAFTVSADGTVRAASSAMQTA
jgi:hypothetical protein